jgi:hypothetical protein
MLNEKKFAFIKTYILKFNKLQIGTDLVNIIACTFNAYDYQVRTILKLLLCTIKKMHLISQNLKWMN